MISYLLCDRSLGCTSPLNSRLVFKLWTHAFNILKNLKLTISQRIVKEINYQSEPDHLSVDIV